jgi:hypothetical protein
VPFFNLFVRFLVLVPSRSADNLFSGSGGGCVTVVSSGKLNRVSEDRVMTDLGNESVKRKLKFSTTLISSADQIRGQIRDVAVKQVIV